MKQLKTVDIKGKAYVMVNERIAHFRELYPQGTIITELLSSVDGTHTFKATAINDGTILSTGHASEKDGSTFINKTSALENAETSSVGRCLGILGIGIDASIASAEEVGNAVAQQEVTPSKEKVSDELISNVKNNMERAYKEGSLKKFFFTLSPEIQEVVREYANELKSSKG
ncbi:hypothetical protein N9J50_01945 [Methylophilaceae bacterium]|nr:hypothetical protein [Methylophilaceae bacterium]